MAENNDASSLLANPANQPPPNNLQATTFERIPEALIQKPSDEMFSRQARDQLRIIQRTTDAGPQALTWGYTIYRTVYTPESDATFPLAIQRLNAFIKVRATFRNARRHPDSLPEDEVWRRHHNDIIEDRDSLDSVTMERVGELFDERVRERMGQDYYGTDSRYNMCIVIDQEVLDQVALLPQDISNRVNTTYLPYVKMVARWRLINGSRYWYQCAIMHLVFVWMEFAADGDRFGIGRLDETDGIYKWIGMSPRWAR